MVPKHKSKPSANLPVIGQTTDSDSDDIPTKADTLEDISEGYRFVMSEGKGQPIDEMHREIAEELAREELAKIADNCR